MEKYNDYKIHIAKKGDSTQSICAQYSVSENDLVKANPGINLAPFGGGFFSAPKFRLDIQPGDKVKIPFHNNDKDKKGVKTIRGKKSVKVGVWENYEVTEWYEGTPKEERNPSKVKWDLYLMKNGTKPELVLQKEEGKIRFQEKAIGNKYKVVGYLHQPELNSGSAVLVNVEAAEKREILSIKISDINNKPVKAPIAYGQTINVHVETTGMKGEYLYVSLWEDDAKGEGHSDSNKHNLVAEGKVLVGNKGIAHKQFVLKADFKKIANAYLSKGDSSEGSTHEYYVTAYASGESKASPNINVRNPDYQQKRKEETQEHLKGTEQTSKKESTTTTPIASETIKVKPDATKIEVAESTTVAKVADSKTTITGVEALVDAYFAKEEFKKETSETAGQHTYTFQKPNKDVDKEKDEIAGIIKKRVDEKVKKDKKYAKLDDIKNALTQKTYAKGTSISFNLYKLGPEYVKINNAPLEEEVYVVAKTVNLDEKEVTIKIREKEAVLMAKDADVKVLEAKENGNEITELKAKVEKGIAKVKVKLRPKSDEDLKTWKEKLKGIKDGSHTYTFASEVTKTEDAEQKKKIAGIILKKVNESLSSQKKFAKLEDIVKALTNEVYNKGEKITFDTYKEITEYLWLKAECPGEVKKHEGEFLKKDGAYFMIGKKCDCEARIRAFIRMVRVGEGTGEMIKSINKKKETVYIPHDFEIGYTTGYGGVKITDLSTHPQIIYDGGSSAAGAYQVMRYTWWELAGFEVEDKKKTGKYFEDRDLLKKYKILDYSAESQDKICVALMKKQRPNLINKIIANKIEEAIQKEACFIWASLPETENESHYTMPKDKTKKQPATPLKTCMEHYNQFLEEELEGNSKLHLKKGFLKDFDITCCSENGSNGACSDDRTQCFEYADVVTNPRLNNQSDNVNKNRWHRTKRYNNSHPEGYYHTGTDILASSGTTVKSMLCGTVYDLKDSFAANEYQENSLGNYIVIKSKDKDGEDVYIKYCHLDEITVTKNQKVKHGDSIGKSGSTGNAASVYEKGKLIHGIDPAYRHIHIEAATSASFGSTRVDPEKYMKTKFDETTKGNPE